MEIVVLGAGIAGLVAASAFSDGNNVVIIDKNLRDDPFSNHSAVLRLRNDKIKDYLKCKLEPVKVFKQAYYNGSLHSAPNIAMNNIYSRKTRDALGWRSINDLGVYERYLISGIEHDFYTLQGEFVGVEKTDQAFEIIIDRVNPVVPDRIAKEFVPADICISTIPMPTMLNCLGNYAKAFLANPIHTATCEIFIKSTVHQTIYFANLSPVYRATVENNKFTVESMDEICEDDVYECIEIFGLSKDNLSKPEFRTQWLGKIVPIDDIQRRKIMMDLTNKFNIYSFGRYAVWKDLRIDQILEDIEKIKLMVKIKHGNWYG